VRAITVGEAIEIDELRMVIEGLFASKAASRIDDAEIEEFRRLRSDMIASIDAGDLTEYQRLNRTLHDRIGEIGGQVTALNMLSRLTMQNNRRFRLPYGRDRAAISVREHIAIIDAIIERDPAAAEQAMRKHLRIVIDWLSDSGAEGLEDADPID
jgi:DNA-binding GntR family transcriptional regulator